MDLKRKEFVADFRPIDDECVCDTCRNHTRSFLHSIIVQKETVACNYITIHNVHYQVHVCVELSEGYLEISECMRELYIWIP